jgi:hypothetical protein
LLKIDIPATATPQTPWRTASISRQRYFQPIKPLDKQADIDYQVAIDLDTLELGSDIYVFGVKTTSAGVGVLTKRIGGDEILATSNSTATGTHILRFKNYSSRDCVFISAKDISDVATNAYVYDNSTYLTSLPTLGIQASGGAGDDGCLREHGNDEEVSRSILLLLARRISETDLQPCQDSVYRSHDRGQAGR